jgi:hypothetical protein
LAIKKDIEEISAGRKIPTGGGSGVFLLLERFRTGALAVLSSKDEGE